MRRRLGLAVGLGLGLAGCGISDAPHLDAVSPSTAARGAMVTITGARFCQGAGVGANGACAGEVAGIVDFGIDAPVRGTVLSWSDTRVDATVPDHAAVGSNDVYLTSNGVSSNALEIVIQ